LTPRGVLAAAGGGLVAVLTALAVCVGSGCVRVGLFRGSLRAASANFWGIFPHDVAAAVSGVAGLMVSNFSRLHAIDCA
jgi:hypothetical protein